MRKNQTKITCFLAVLTLLVSCTIEPNLKEGSIQNHHLKKIKHNLFINPDSGEMYFAYAIPHRTRFSDEDRAISRITYDSLIMLDSALVRINTIIDTATYQVDNEHENYQDKHYIYTSQDFNISPKHTATRRE